jgi:hypothetical protein
VTYDPDFAVFPPQLPPRPRLRALSRLRHAVRTALWAGSGRLCGWHGPGRRIAFEAGHLLGEAGWKLRDPS